MWIINSTIVDNKAFYEGAGVCANGNFFDDDVRAVHIINCTIAGNTCSADPSSYIPKIRKPVLSLTPVHGWGRKYALPVIRR